MSNPPVTTITHADLMDAVADRTDQMPALITDPTRPLFDPETLKGELTAQSVPLERMRLLTSELKLYLDRAREMDLREGDIFKARTLQWTELYKDALEKLHKMEYGDKTINTNITYKVNHGDIARAIRKSRVNPTIVDTEIVEEKK